MGFFKKTKPIATVAETGRRRPVDMAAPRGASTMFSYHSRRSNAAANLGRRDVIEPTADPKSRGMFKQFTRLSRGRLAVLGCFGVGALLLFVSSMLTPTPRVILLEDSTTTYFLQDKQVYERAAENVLQKSWINRYKLTVDTASVRRELLNQYPEIKNVSVALPILGHQPQIYIEPYKPSFVLTTTNGGAYLLDATGRALASTSQIEDIEGLGVPTIQDKTGLEVRLGSRAIPSSTVAFTQTIIKALSAKNVTISTLALPAGAYQLDVGVAGQKYYVKYNLQNDALQQAGTYLAVQNRLAADRITPAEYIDVRVTDRAYYK